MSIFIFEFVFLIRSSFKKITLILQRVEKIKKYNERNYC